MRAVLDSTILVSAYFTPGGLSAEILALARAGAFRICLSLPILLEVERVLHTTKRRRSHPYPDEEITRYLNLLGIVSDVITDLPLISGVVRDPNDDMVLACAVGGAAPYIVSRDKDLLSLGRYQSIEIVSPELFIHVLRGDQGQ